MPARAAAAASAGFNVHLSMQKPLLSRQTARYIQARVGILDQRDHAHAMSKNPQSGSSAAQAIEKMRLVADEANTRLQPRGKSVPKRVAARHGGK